MKAKSKSELKLRQDGDFVEHATESADPASWWLWSSSALIVFAPDFISELVWKRISVEFFSEIGHKIGQKLTNTILTIWDITLKVVLRALSTGLCLPFISPHDKWLNQIIRSNCWWSFQSVFGSVKNRQFRKTNLSSPSLTPSRMIRIRMSVWRPGDEALD